MNETVDVLRDVLWIEKYRPTTLDEVALDADARKLLSGYVAAGEIPHLLFVGPPGSGKTTVARILCASLDCRTLVLNASSDRGIDVVREKIGNFAQSLFVSKWNVVFLDEADAMTSDAQTALRNLIEAYHDRTRFILTANHPYRIIGPIQSRCQIVSFAPPPLRERFRILSGVLSREGVRADPAVVLQWAERHSDMRRLLHDVQKAVLIAGGRDAALPPPKNGGGADGAELFALVASKNWARLRSLCTSGDFDPARALRELFWAIPDEHPKAGFLRHVVGRGVHESGFTPDPVVLFLGVCAEAMDGLQ